MIAQLGAYEFEVSAESLRTFRDMKFSNSASYTEHKVLGRKGVLEFTGLNASTCSLSIDFNADYGVDPLDEIADFWDMMNEHEAVALVVGGRVMGEDLWVIESFDEEYDEIDNEGYVSRAHINLKLKEYLEDE